MKPINFKPNATDAALIAAIKSYGGHNNNSELLRLAIAHYAKFIIPSDEHDKIILKSYNDNFIF